MFNNIFYKNIAESDFPAVIELGTKVHGEGYIDTDTVTRWVNQGIKDDINASFIAYHDKTLVGFRLTFAPNQWQIDKWCSPERWGSPVDKVCYFKCNTVNSDYRGHGIGSQLLKLSIVAAKKQGAVAGVSHLWMESPGNSAVKYFTKCGGTLIKEHINRWNEWCEHGYVCTICGTNCQCTAAEMMIHFDAEEK